MHEVRDADLLLATSAPASDVWAEVDAARLPRDRVRIAAVQGLDDLRDALAVGAVAAVPRRTCAGFPIKLLNTLGAGVVTVAADGSAQPIAGCVPGGDTAGSLAQALNVCLADADRMQALGRDARADVATRWSWTARATDLLQLYATLR
jgi:glycosyltransferase involved in cell wall biosynthesis